MNAHLIDGNALARELNEASRLEIQQLQAQGKTPGLAVVLANRDPASVLYARRKEKICAELGLNFKLLPLPDSVAAAELLSVVHHCNQDPDIDGIILEQPLPPQLSPQIFLEAIQPSKDVEGLHPVNLGLLLSGKPLLTPCTPAAVMSILASLPCPLSGTRAVVIGRSTPVGKPLALLLLQANATVSIVHSQSRNLSLLTRQADLIVTAAGKAQWLTGFYVKPGAVVIDVGINQLNAKIVGDAHFDSVSQVASWLTPVPGGVGPVTTALLVKNLLQCCRLQLKT